MGVKETAGGKENRRYLELYQEILGAKSALKVKHRESVTINDEAVARRPKEGKHLIDIEKIEIDEKLLGEFFQGFLPIMKAHRSFLDLGIEDLERKKAKIGLGKLVRSVLVGDLGDLRSLAQGLNLNPDLLLFFGLHLGQTLLELYAQRLKQEIDCEDWLGGKCPLCGNFPAMEKLRREDGRRILWCGLCGTQWRYKRIMCPFCGNQNHNSLRYFFTEKDSSSGEDPFRVDVCDRCKTYIKTIDERKMPESESPDLSLENISTLYLDILAQKDGYQSPTYLKTQISGWIMAASEKEVV